MNTVKCAFVHDDCGNEAQVMNVYLRLDDNCILVEGVCVCCNDGFVRTYSVVDIFAKYGEIPPAKFTEQDKKLLREMHIKDEEAA